MSIQKLSQGNLIYYISHPSPSVLFLSGMHGDENESGILFEALLHSQNKLPSFIYIPAVSPSAITSRTRHNQFDHDINRHFFDHTKDAEADAVMKLLRSYKVTTCIDIHEDPDRTQEFYIYDSHHMTNVELDRYRKLVRQAGATLYTGIDDTIDTTLGCDIVEGYYAFSSSWFADSTEDAGFASKWIIRTGIAKRVFTVEIPGKASTNLKQSLIKTITPFLATFS